MCTNFLIKVENKGTVVGRSMENAADIGDTLFFRSVGYEYKQDLVTINDYLKEHNIEPLNLKEEVMHTAKSWFGIYGFVAMEAQHTGIAANGMNTEGLTTGDMTLLETEYQSIDDLGEKEVILFPYLVNWILSMCNTCEDVRLKLTKKVRVVNPIEDVKPGFKFHFPVTDADGNSIVIEYIKGELVIHENSIPGKPGVLTNDPTFEWQLANLSNYVSVSPINAENDDKLTNNFTMPSPWQGSGFDALPGSSTPPARFVRVAMMTNYAYPVDNLNDATTLAFHVLNTVDIPFGTSRLSDKEKIEEGFNKEDQVGDKTLWVSVSNLTELIYSVRVYGSTQVFSVNLKDLDLSKNGGLDEVQYELPNDWPASLSLNEKIKSLANVSLAAQ
ncbi:MAG: linear amide C-N hydrolase [Crocinitomicaceae bacterium]|nr:linear amide C-N hydrolase [Flavobacteriales bacterium]NQZ35540.1 linear amide C-N hydrolase [Crocinitomicaceae bacterium]